MEIDWKKSKTLKRTFWKETRFSIVDTKGWPLDTILWWRTQLRAKAVEPERMVFDTLNSQKVMDAMKKERREYSEHSIRRGRLWQLAEDIVLGRTQPPEGMDGLDMIRRVARHECRETTLQYLEGSPYLARLITMTMNRT